MTEILPFLIVSGVSAAAGAFLWHYLYTQGAVVEAELKARITALETNILGIFVRSAPPAAPVAPPAPPAPPPAK